MKNELFDWYENECIGALSVYELKPGAYIKIALNNIEYFYIKEKDEPNNLYDENGTLVKNEIVDWFKERDFYSNYLNSNKAVADKKMHNANFLTLFFKIDNYDKTAIFESYDNFRDFTKFNKSIEKQLLQNDMEYINSQDRQNQFNLIKKLFDTKFDEIIAYANKVTKKYVKIYFDDSIEAYKNEFNIYLRLKIFNNNDYTYINENSIIGLSDFNMGMNSKKPYLEHKTRNRNINIKSGIPFLTEQSICIEKELPLFTWMKFQKKSKIDLNKNIYLRKINENDKAVIVDFDYLPMDLDDRREELNIYNYFLKNESDTCARNSEEYRAIINEYLYNYSLLKNIYADDIKAENKYLENLLYSTRNLMIEFLDKGNINALNYAIKKYKNSFLIAMWSLDEYCLKRALNFIISIEQKNAKGDVMDLDTIAKNVKSKLRDDSINKLDGYEYYFLVGNVAYMLLLKSEAKEKKFDMAEPYFNAKSSEKLLHCLRLDFERYSHDIYLKDSKFIKAFRLCMNCTNKIITSDEQTALIAGMMYENIIYDKGEKNE